MISWIEHHMRAILIVVVLLLFAVDLLGHRYGDLFFLLICLAGGYAIGRFSRKKEPRS